jgi:nanoRNase/pAp phosphatase (c-di-AMP/oligoRNAs hydrolase)
MRFVVICPDILVPHFAGAMSLPGGPPVYLAASASARRRLGAVGRGALVGTLTDPEFLSDALRGRHGAVVASPLARIPAVAAALREAAGPIPVLVVGDPRRPIAGTTTLPLGSLLAASVEPAIDRMVVGHLVEKIRARFTGAERVLILMQDDPDPDAIASGLALRTLLGRTRASAPICTFGSITRAENVAMCRILEIDVEEIRAAAVRQFDRVALVDVQPSFLEEPLGTVDLVIDHHPVEQPIQTRLKDVRPGYGATSTILVEHLRAVDAKIPQRLATALFYGIKSDTLGLERGGTRADLEAFTFLYPQANHAALRRIERPELSEAALDTLAQGLARRHIEGGVFFSHLGTVASGDLVPQFADFGLQAEGVEWSVVSGVVRDEVHVSVRNVGWVKSAGDVTRAAFADLGSAGGHRTMAKAVFPLARLRPARGGGTGQCAERIRERFLRALAPNGK